MLWKKHYSVLNKGPRFCLESDNLSNKYYKKESASFISVFSSGFLVASPGNTPFEIFSKIFLSECMKTSEIKN